MDLYFNPEDTDILHDRSKLQREFPIILSCLILDPNMTNPVFLVPDMHVRNKKDMFT